MTPNLAVEPFEKTVRLSMADPLGDGTPRPLVLHVTVSLVPPEDPALDFDLRPLPAEIFQISFCGHLLTPDGTESEGWMEGDIFGGEELENPAIRRLAELLRYWSGNRREGTREQLKALGDTSFLSQTHALDRLARLGLDEVPLPEESRVALSRHLGFKKKVVTHYRFGSARLLEPVPPEAIAEIQSLLALFPDDPFRD